MSAMLSSAISGAAPSKLVSKALKCVRCQFDFSTRVLQYIFLQEFYSLHFFCFFVLRRLQSHHNVSHIDPAPIISSLVTAGAQAANGSNSRWVPNYSPTTQNLFFKNHFPISFAAHIFIVNAFATLHHSPLTPTPRPQRLP